MSKDLLPVISVFIVNIIGIVLKYFNLDQDIILLGFRFHLSFVLPFLFILIKKDNLEIIKNYLLHPEDNKRYVLTAVFVFIPVLILIGVLLLLKSVEIGDPDYFYELGLTSIFDFPIYLMWNLPQLLMFSSFLYLTSYDKKHKLSVIFLLIVSLFIYEFIPIKASQFALLDVITFFFAIVIFSMFYVKVRNVYFFSFALFSILWSNILIFGSNSRILVNLLLAKTYLQWDGFLEVKKTFYPYILLAHFAIAFILFFVPFILNSRQNNRSIKNEYQMENLNK